jgi:hypothetical protein
MVEPRMITDLDIYRSAGILIKKHGAGALLEAMNRIETYRAAGDNDGMAVWQRIADAVEALRIPAHLTTETIQ